jgi:hypothetical protein
MRQAWAFAASPALRDNLEVARSGAADEIRALLPLEHASSLHDPAGAHHLPKRPRSRLADALNASLVLDHRHAAPTCVDSRDNCDVRLDFTRYGWSAWTPRKMRPGPPFEHRLERQGPVDEGVRPPSISNAAVCTGPCGPSTMTPGRPLMAATRYM